MGAVKEYIKYASLNMMGMLGLSCYILADTFFVAKGLGGRGLAALNLALPVYSLIHGAGLMLAMGGASRFSICKGQKIGNQGDRFSIYKGQKMGNQGDRFSICKGQKIGNQGNQIFSQTVFLAACFALLFVLVGITAPDQVASLLGAHGEVHKMCRTYLKVVLLFSPAILANNLLICFVRNDGVPQLAMAAMLGGSFSNIILDYIFIFPCRMGMFGAAFATGLAPVVSIGILSLFFLGGKNTFHLVKTSVSPGNVQKIAAGGAPSLVTELSSGIVIIIFNAIMLSLMGTAGVAAYGVIANLSLVVISVFTGIAQGIQPLVSRYYGEGNLQRVWKIFNYARVTVVGLSVLIYAGVYAWAEQIVAVFNSEGNARLQEVAVEGAKLYFTAIAFAGFNIVTAIYFTSSGRAKPGNIISLLRGFVLIIPLAFLMSEMFGVKGLWMAFPLTEALTALAAGGSSYKERLGRV